MCLVYQVKTSCFFSTHHYVLFHGEEKSESKTSRLLKEAEQSIASAETSVNKANSIVAVSYK
ncbi:hypothetical protein ACINWC141_1939 [Acinetobacter sp. WC-141]|nr:hypothetical protein ACINWC141_1939 [Acinetobacter sp. WC-141]